MPEPLSKTVIEYIRAGFSGIWIRTDEHTDAIDEIARAVMGFGWMLQVYDPDKNLLGYNASGELGPTKLPTSPMPTPASTKDHHFLDLLRLLPSQEIAVKQDGKVEAGFYVLAAKNMHPMINTNRDIGPGNKSVVLSVFANALTEARRTNGVLIHVTASQQIPPELEKLFVVIDHPLPDRETLKKIVLGVATNPKDIESEEQMDAVVEASLGCTPTMAENAVALSIVRHGKVLPEAVWEVKARSLKQAHALEVHAPHVDDTPLEQLLGLDGVVDFSFKSARSRGRARSKPKGVLLLGPPGTGKTAFAKAMGNALGIKTVILDVGSLRGGIVGQTEERTRSAIRTIDAMGHIVLLIDEINLMLDTGNSGQTDGGVGSRMMGTIMSWLSSRNSDAFVIGTCNEMQSLPDALTRAGRFDGVFFVDLPSRAAKDQMWKNYKGLYRIESDYIPDDSNWTGSEIRHCCDLADRLQEEIEVASQKVVPVATRSLESLNGLRGWATARCLSAHTGDVYNSAEGAAAEEQPRKGAAGVRRTVARAK